MCSWFDILQTKGVEKEFTNREKEHIINRAQMKYVNEVLQKKYLPSLKENEKAEMVYSSTESVIAGHDAIFPLLWKIGPTTIGSGGLIDFSVIRPAIASRLIAMNLKPTGWTSPPIMMIFGVVIDYGVQGKRINCRYLNMTDSPRNQMNIYRRATESQPTYQLEEGRINIEPNSVAGEDCLIFGVREPKPVSHSIIDSNTSSAQVNCELPDFTHDEIMAIALDDAGVAKRDDALMKLNKANKENLAENF